VLGGIDAPATTHEMGRHTQVSQVTRPRGSIMSALPHKHRTARAAADEWKGALFENIYEFLPL